MSRVNGWRMGFIGRTGVLFLGDCSEGFSRRWVVYYSEKHDRSNPLIVPIVMLIVDVNVKSTIVYPTIGRGSTSAPH